MEEERKNIELKDIPKKDIYQVPEGYFDALQDKIHQRIEAKEGQDVASTVRRVNWRMISYAAAACITLLVVTFLAVQEVQQGTSPDALLAEVSSADLIAYLENSELDAYDIIEGTAPAIWQETLEDPVEALEPHLNEEDVDLLFELYGVSPDETLQTF